MITKGENIKLLFECRKENVYTIKPSSRKNIQVHDDAVLDAQSQFRQPVDFGRRIRAETLPIIIATFDLEII